MENGSDGEWEVGVMENGCWELGVGSDECGE